MMTFEKPINYKGYRIKVWKGMWGYYQILIEKYDYKFKSYKYVHEIYDLYTRDIKEARKAAKKYIDNLGGK